MPAPTPRQREILELRCRRGLSVEDTAADLCIAEKTVWGHTHALLRRIGCRTFAQACYRHGLAATGPRVPVMYPWDV